jgi:uncharacterized protein DUF4440
MACRFLLCVAAGLLASAAGGCARAGPARAAAPADASGARLATVRRELVATFQSRHHAFEAKDFVRLMNQVDPAFSAVRPDGTRMTRDDLAVYIRRNLDRWVRITSWSNEIETLRMDGANAIVDMRQRVARIQIVDGREAVVESAVLQTETWAPSGEGWRLLAVRDEREKSVTVDGRPIP